MQFLVVELMDVHGMDMVDADEYRIPSKETIKVFYSTLAAAERSAKMKAASNPGKQYMVMSPTVIFETTKPTFIEKVINDAGEMVLKKDGA